MKKKILVALVLCLVLILSVSLVACGSKDTSTPDATPTTQGDGGNSGGSSGGDSGSGSGGGQGGQGGGSQTSTKTLPTETAILQTIGTTSFKLAVGDLSGTAVTTITMQIQVLLLVKSLVILLIRIQSNQEKQNIQKWKAEMVFLI